MNVRVGLVVLLVLAGNWACDARNFAASHHSGVENAGRNLEICTLCEEYATLALDYLSANKTQNEVIEALHKACFQMHNLAEQCLTLVDYYAPLFFFEVTSVQPEGFCKRVGLCRNAQVSFVSAKKNTCDLCHEAVDEALAKLRDPDTELEVIQVLLKACNAVGRYTAKCKTMVFEFGPLILTDAGKFIETVDLCTTFHACREHKANSDEVFADAKIEMVTS